MNPPASSRPSKASAESDSFVTMTSKLVLGVHPGASRSSCLRRKPTGTGAAVDVPPPTWGAPWTRGDFSNASGSSSSLRRCWTSWRRRF